METKTIKITNVVNIYQADNKLREYCMFNNAFPVGVDKITTTEYRGHYTPKIKKA